MEAPLEESTGQRVLGSVLAKKGMWDEAISILKDCRLKGIEFQAPKEVAEADLRLGIVFADKGDSEEARKYLEAALKAFREMGVELYAKRAQEALDGL